MIHLVVVSYEIPGAAMYRVDEGGINIEVFKVDFPGELIDGGASFD